MDAHTRKRFMSSGSDTPAHKVQAVQEPPFAFADILTVHLLNALNATEPSQRSAFLDDMIARIQWLKQQSQQAVESPNARKFTPPGKTSLTSPKQENKAFDPQHLQNTIKQQLATLNGISKSVALSTQLPPPPHPSSMIPMQMPQAPALQVPQAPPPAAPSSTVSRTPVAPPPVHSAPIQKHQAPSLVPAPVMAPPNSSVPVVHPNMPFVTKSPTEPPKKKSPIPILSVPTPQAPVNVLPKRSEPQTIAPRPPLMTPQMQEAIKTAEATLTDIQEQQARLVGYISSNHGGNLPNEMLHTYLKYPYITLRENGHVRHQINPFYHLMPPQGRMDPSAPNSVSTATPSPSPSVNSLTPGNGNQNLRLVPPPVPLVSPPRRPSTPIPAPPVLVPQVELPLKRESTINKKDSPSPIEKVSPPPHLPRQVGFESCSGSPTIKSFEPPTTRKCNQWSVFSMALPLRLVCHRCFPMPCRCQQ